MTEGWPIPLRTALRRGQQLVAEVPASAPGQRAWVAIHPIRPSAPAGDKQAFNLFHREFDASYIDNDWCIGPGDGMTDLRTAQAQDENDLKALLISWGVEPGQLTYVHRTDYPV
ncbi:MULTISPECIES: hypothetical protein [unclassified Micromonospora]|uniref:hypothetical protein n=1 Tax=unclassified Micromonospora TaxID=2617518 RepID=UPI0022B69F24|nr:MULTISPECIES: hypothetical protein [unclassified Micromonospora]MCZ7421547.1 hypothetical protein [Verrucosispora sp. WMMA2121]WBB93766.1 hypothetical protein O7597_12710 [Verrucosispora sp. WMMC514]